MPTLVLVMGWTVSVLLGLLAALLLYYIWIGKIDLTYLISERDGQASLSRFQFLIFTFVIAMSFFLIVVGGDTPAFPDVPTGVYALLGISGGSYVVSKGIQQGGGKGGK